MIEQKLQTPSFYRVAGVPPGYDAVLLAQLASDGRDVLFVARDDVRLAQTIDALAFFAPTVRRLALPAWDCLPYDRVSPNASLLSRRIETLAELADGGGEPQGRVVVATVSALLQRLPPRALFAGARQVLKAGDRVDFGDLLATLERFGYGRAETVMEPGEFALRGGILDIFPPGRDEPLRLDFFGDELEGVRTFDPSSQRTTGRGSEVRLLPVSEIVLDDASVTRFRSGYRTLFGIAGSGDPLYESISSGRRHIGYEHWLPLFHERLETLFDYLPAATIVLDHQAEEAKEARLDLIAEYFHARVEVTGAETGAAAMPYRPVPPDRMFVAGAELALLLQGRIAAAFSPFAEPETAAIDGGGHPGRDFRDLRVAPDANVFDALRDHIAEARSAGRRVLLTAMSAGSADRLSALLREHGVAECAIVESPDQLQAAGVGLAVLGLERGFVAPGLLVVTEQDVLGERFARAPGRRRIRPENFITEASALTEGDLVVHVDHGIGRYAGLETISVAGAPHDCLQLVYEGGDKLYLPVENIELISRYGSEEAGVQLDKLGGAAWQARKARLKQRVREMADELIRIAAARALRQGARFTPPEGLFDEFAARFPYAETEDQLKAIQDTLEDLSAGHPMDRLICGDVGFGKTEVALRAAFVAAMSGKQVAVVVPTTLLSRQHYMTFAARFANYPIQVEQLSRLVSSKKAAEVKQGLAAGTVDVVIGTHALLAKSLRFRDLGLLIVDEEQHFGVAHKERLKSLKADVHVLTLTATPIPRTLQLALTGVRELSLIATPPVDRLAVRTFVLPFDPVVIREAIMRERFRGGQTFYVCPRIEDLGGIRDSLAKLVPEAKVVVAHGRMAPTELEQAVTDFYDGKYDILLSTNIIESGLDLPAVNTIVIHRADMFGLAQLYQLRGRVGRSKIRAYAYLTLPPRQKISKTAEKRLEVMQTLDSLGAGFSLASHDLDIRGAGNLLGAEQSGHIREVGIELYQQMLEEAVAEARGGELAEAGEESWSPQINVGTAILIPEAYVGDLNVRMSLYRRIAKVDSRDEIDALAAEMVDRFGPLPPEVENLLEIVDVKRLCRLANVEKVEAGPKGALAAFRNNTFANPAGLVAYLGKQSGTAKLRLDHRLVLMRSWETPAERLRGVRRLAQELASLAAAAPGAG